MGVVVLRRGGEGLLRGHDREIGHSAAERTVGDCWMVYATQGGRVEVEDGVMRYRMGLRMERGRCLTKWAREDASTRGARWGTVDGGVSAPWGYLGRWLSAKRAVPHGFQ